MTQAVDTGKEIVTLYLPAGRWVHVWSGEEYGSPDGGTHQTVGPPVGEPALFYR
jgi:alpha-glucosidase (family GH31 glycosyl hydrolase)